MGVYGPNLSYINSTGVFNSNWIDSQAYFSIQLIHILRFDTFKNIIYIHSYRLDVNGKQAFMCHVYLLFGFCVRMIVNLRLLPKIIHSWSYPYFQRWGQFKLFVIVVKINSLIRVIETSEVYFDKTKWLTPNLSVVADVTPAVVVKYVVTLKNFLEQFALIFVIERFVTTQAETQTRRQAPL